MPDEKLPEQDAQQPLFTPAKEGDGTQAAPTLEDLQERLADAERRSQILEESFQALNAPRGEPSTQPQTPQPATPGMGGLPRDMLDRVKSRTGLDDAQAAQWLQFAGVLFEELGRPAFQALYTLADQTDRLEARMSIDGYKELEQAVETERQKRPNASRTELYHIVRSRELPKILKAERERAQTEGRRRTAAGRGATAEAGSTDAAHPSPARTQRRLTTDDLAKMSREDRIKALEAAAEGRTI